MGWSPTEISLLAVELLAALALAVMWFADRERTYTLWWAIAHLMLPVPAVLITFANAQNNPTLPVVLVLCLCNATQIVALTAGAIDYRFSRLGLNWRHVATGVVGLGGGFYLLMYFLGADATRLAMVGGMAVALVASAALMWSASVFERVAAVCFGARGALELGLVYLAVTGEHQSYWFTHFLGFNALVAITTILALLIAAYQRSLKRMRAQYRFLELSREITEQLQGVSDEASLAERVLSLIIERLDWEQGVFFRQPDAEALDLVAVSSLPADNARRTRAGSVFQPPEGGMIAIAIRTRKVCYSLDLMGDDRVTAEYRKSLEIQNNPCLVVVPATHDGVVHGVIVLCDSRRRELSRGEIRVLESLGQVVGISAAHSRNLRELAHRADHDTLTGLGNRAALHDHLACCADDRYAVLLFDLDHFKQVNDALGHAVGDSLLCAIADRLQEHLADSPARLFRLGGDEFVVLYRLGKGSGTGQALAVAARMGEKIACPVEVGELSLRMSASIGVALAPEHSTDSHELLRCADVAMYHAKHRGTGIALYQREIDAYKLEDLTLLSAVNEGLEQQQFTLFYQPIVDASNNKIRRCEALIRWRHPKRGLIEAHEFMPLIENTDLIRPVTRRVIDIAMADAAGWHERGIDYRLAINLSARNVLDPELPEYLLRAAARHGVDPKCVQLEITETILINDPNSAGKVLHELADAGFTLALDDFGTGFSSMTYLARFPIHMLKIDRSFVHAMLEHAQSRAIVETTIALARGLGLKVTAEGVEYEEELRVLNELGCDYAQGFLYGRPMPEQELAQQWLRESRSAGRRVYLIKSE